MSLILLLSFLSVSRDQGARDTGAAERGSAGEGRGGGAKGPSTGKADKRRKLAADAHTQLSVRDVAELLKDRSSILKGGGLTYLSTCRGTGAAH